MFRNMWKVSLLLVISTIFIVEGCTYRDRECPDYVVLETHEDYEIRQYPALTWVSSSAEHRYSKIAQTRAFMSLFAYINGENSRKLHINMTVPVKMNTTDNGETTIYKMNFMVPSEYAENPPIPNNKNLTISHEPPTTYAVRTFPGYVWRQATWIEEAENLAKSVKDDGTVDKTWYYQVGYEGPHIFVDRRNEIWMQKSSQEWQNEV